MPLSPDPEPLRQLFASFDELVDLDAGERRLRLDALSERDPASAAELGAMLRADRPGEELEIERRLAGPAEGEAAPLAAGEPVGPYRIVRRLGQGGMGVVYLATRSHQGFEQAVALKLLRPEVVTPRAVERFHRECRIQARLTHPAIVPLIDAGIAPDGRPFLALQYVEGRPITTHADQHQLSTPDRLRLVVACCRAVELAHQKLVVHRDLKPSNILVGDDGAVRLLDFGIAKVLGEDDDHELTRLGPAPMTPARAAPEQLRGEPSTTATDVWGLGVLLHEMVTGRLPAGASDSRPAAVGDDLGVVIARALAAEPERRYGSAAALADDLERLLAGRPIAARPDTVGYRLRRFVGRHRLGVAAAGLAGITLAALGVSTAVQSLRVARERDRAQSLEQQSTAVVALLIELFGATAPNRGAGVGEVSIDQLLRQGESRAESLAEAPHVRQRMLATLGRIRLERSELAQGLALLERARSIADGAGEDPLEEERLALELDYGQALFRLDQRAAARAVLEPLVARLERSGGGRNAELAEALAQLSLVVPAAESLPWAERALEIRRRLEPPRPVELASSLDAMGNLAFRRGDFALAQGYWREALPILERELGEEDLRTLSTLNNLAAVTPEVPAQLEMLGRVLALQQRLLGPEAGPVANTWNNLGVARAELGDHEAAEEALRESYRLRTLVLGADHRETVRTLRNVARVAELRGRYDEALALFDQVIDRLPATGSPLDTWPMFKAQRASVLWRLGRRVEAENELGPALAALRAGLPPGHDGIVSALLLTSRMAAERGDLEQAVAVCREVVAARDAAFAPAHPKNAEARAELGRMLILTGQTAEGRALLAAALPVVESWGLLHADDRAALRAANSVRRIEAKR